MKYGLDTDTDVLLRSGSQQSRSQQSQESCWFWWDLISCSHQDINTSKYDQQDIQPHSHWLQFLLQWWITQILRHLRNKYLEVLSYKNNQITWKTNLEYWKRKIIKSILIDYDLNGKLYPTIEKYKIFSSLSWSVLNPQKQRPLQNFQIDIYLSSLQYLLDCIMLIVLS